MAGALLSLPAASVISILSGFGSAEAAGSVASLACAPGAFCPENESGVIDFLDWYEGVVRRRAGAAVGRAAVG